MTYFVKIYMLDGDKVVLDFETKKDQERMVKQLEKDGEVFEAYDIEESK